MLFKPEEFKVVSKEKQAEDVYLLRVSFADKGDKKGKKNKKSPLLKFDYQPGQFYQLSILGIGEVPISVASFSDEYVEFNIKGVGDVTDKLIALEKEDSVWLRGPYGTNYPMKMIEGNNLVIIGGGTGVAPLRGVLKYLEKHRADYERVHLFFGFRGPDEILFKDDIKQWNRIFDLNMTVDNAPKSYKGKVGLVTKVVEQSGINNKNKIVLICGPPIMIKFVVQTLEKMGFNHDQLFVSLERRMKCGTGMCGHCMISGIYVCKDGPVFRYDQVKDVHE